MTLEIPPVYDVYPIFQHELFHAFIETKHTEMERAVVGVTGLDYMTLNEGWAYALSLGILHPANGSPDPLCDAVTSSVAGGRPLSDNFTAFNRFGLGLRPLVQEALADKTHTFTDYLPRAIDAWRVVRELSAALDSPAVSQSRRGGGSGGGLRDVFVFGPDWHQGTPHDSACRADTAAPPRSDSTDRSAERYDAIGVRRFILAHEGTAC